MADIQKTVPTDHIKRSSRLKNALTNGVNKIKPFFKSFWVFVFILFFVALSQISLRYNTEFGVYMNGLAILALLFLSVLNRKSRQLAISVAILPVATMISLIMPSLSNYSETIIFYDSILILGLIYRYMFTLMNKKQVKRVPLKSYAIMIPALVIFGQILGVIGYLLLKNHYPFGGDYLPLVAASAAVFALTEETFFRGLIQNKGSKFMHPVLAAILTIAIFVLATLNHTTILEPVFALILGTALSVVYYYRQNLILSGTLNLSTKLTYIALMASFVFR